jgi:hypothetical protein
VQLSGYAGDQERKAGVALPRCRNPHGNMAYILERMEVGGMIASQEC